MRIRLLAFASAAEAMGSGETALEVEAASSVGDLRRTLTAKYPALEGLWERLAIAVDGEIAREERLLEEGSEVALLPPVSGGSSSPRAWLVDQPIDVQELTDRMDDSASGALVIFLGRPRNQTHQRAVEKLTYTGYRAMAESALDKIASDLEKGTPGLVVRIVHRLGEVAIGEPSVAIAASSPHREAAFGASREALERLKREVPIWKREHYTDGEVAWREEENLAPPTDPASAARRSVV